MRNTTRCLLSKLTLGVLASASLLGCGPAAVDPVTVLQNEAVDPQTRAQIQRLNTRVLNGFLEDDPTALRELFADDVLAAIESGPGIDQVFAQIRDVLAGTTMAPFHSFDITLAELTEEPLTIPVDGNHGYSLSLPQSSPRMHVSLVEAKAGPRDHVVGMVYTRQEEAWRLQALRVGGLRAGGKTAGEWHAEARRLSEQELYVPAAMRLLLTGGLLRPLPFLHYDDEDAVRTLEQQVSSTLAQAHSFPLALSGLPGPPSVIRLDPVFQGQQLLTLVTYVTAESLDQAAIDAEVPRVHDALSELLPGLCHESSRVAYKVFAEPPIDPQKSYTFINAVATCR